jgi:hypothetical protein
MSKSEIIRLRVTTEEKADWTLEAERSSESLSAWIRRHCNDPRKTTAESTEDQATANGSVLLDPSKPA